MKKIKIKNGNDILDNHTGIVEFHNGEKYWYLNGQLHREVGPCTTCKDCLEGNFELCSKPGPAVEYPNGTKEWFLNGKLHRIDGPAVECSNGAKHWFLNGQCHRKMGPCTMCKNCLEGNFELCSKPGPAVVWDDGTKEWFLNGQLHREDGPAVDEPDGRKEYYLNGERLNKNKINFWLELEYPEKTAIKLEHFIKSRKNE